MRTSEGAQAVIRRGPAEWLAQWNPKWGCFNFVGGHRRADESFRDCLLREVEEELGLHRDADFHVGDIPAGRAEFTAWSESATADTAYILELWDVILTPAAAEGVSADPANRWVTSAEVQSGATADGRPVSPTMRRLLAVLGQM
jgi:8-oxo-dGTP pyrophosphatase MutT (NUDIX family)